MAGLQTGAGPGWLGRGGGVARMGQGGSRRLGEWGHSKEMNRSEGIELEELRSDKEEIWAWRSEELSFGSKWDSSLRD